MCVNNLVKREAYEQKMFREYGIYCNDKLIGLIGDNQFFVKKTKAGEILLNPSHETSHYKGGKKHFVLDQVEKCDLLSQFIQEKYEELPISKPKN